MADKESKLKIEVGVEVDESSVQKAVKDVEKKVSSSLNNGYIKLPAKVGKFKYPEQKVAQSARPLMGGKEYKYGTDYSRLQKAQDELVSNWKKLSKKGGFSSPEKDLVKIMQLFREYQNEVKHTYPRSGDDLKDEQVSEIRNTIGKSLYKYFTRLLPRAAINGKKTSFMNLETGDGGFENYAKLAIRRHKAATAAGVDLSKDVLSKKDLMDISKKDQEIKQKTTTKSTKTEKKFRKDQFTKIKSFRGKLFKDIQQPVFTPHRTQRRRGIYQNKNPRTRTLYSNI